MLVRKRFVIHYLCIIILIYWCTQYLFWSSSSLKPQTKRNTPKLFIAANLYNNEGIVEHWATQLYKLAQWAGPDRAYISIYENGSTDKTKSMLLEFDQQLTHSNIPHNIILDDTPKNYSERRIPLLAKRRNQALAPLYQQDTTFDRILFLNDIWFDWTDAVGLIESNDDYDAVCSMDFYGQYYDEFATREIDGGWLGSGNYPYFKDRTSRQLLVRQELVPVYSCWGGMVAYNAAPFMIKNTTTLEPLLAFRSLWPDDPQPPLEASECCLIHSDLRDLNYTRIFINPKIKVAYDHFHYWYAHYLLPIRQLFLSWTNTPISMSEQEKMLWNKKLASVGPLNSGDSTCLWRPASYD
ncbi:cryptococcal mannosyltransferase 1-domain-containing protein [Chlamydoabsidia padenii]|nr:cryptococcal mannosyltransferase 1-domain-containing protein [Chlamydoabsidia padenii]